jgi:hypothetical protein
VVALAAARRDGVAGADRVRGAGEPREIPFDELIGVEIRPSQEPSGRRSTLVVKLRAGDSFALESDVDR